MQGRDAVNSFRASTVPNPLCDPIIPPGGTGRFRTHRIGHARRRRDVLKSNARPFGDRREAVFRLRRVLSFEVLVREAPAVPDTPAVRCR